MARTCSSGSWSLWSKNSIFSVASQGSAFSIGSVHCLGSAFSAGSVGAIGSIASAGSIGSAFSAGSIGSLFAAGGVGRLGDSRTVDPRWVGGATAAVCAGVLAVALARGCRYEQSPQPTMPGLD